MSKLEHAKTIKPGMTIFNGKTGVIVPIVASWWTLDKDEEPESVITPMPEDTARAIYGHPIAIQFDDVEDWQQLTAMSQITGNAQLLAMWLYLKIIEIQRNVEDLTKKVNRIKLLGR